MPAALAREFLAGGAREKREHFSANRCSLAPCVPRSQLGVATAAGHACREQRSAGRSCGGVGRRAQRLASSRSTHARGACVGCAASRAARLLASVCPVGCVSSGSGCAGSGVRRSFGDLQQVCAQAAIRLRKKNRSKIVKCDCKIQKFRASGGAPQAGEALS